MTYRYHALDVQSFEIRLLTILPGDFCDDICMTIRHARLSDCSTDWNVLRHKVDNSGSTSPVMGQLSDSSAPDELLCTGSAEASRREESLSGASAFEWDPEEGYEALSYTWGSQDNPKQVFVDMASSTNAVTSITGSLDMALRHIRSTKHTRNIWIDAICINQNDDIEKSHQVANMAAIYSQARRVVVWVGPEENNSNTAMLLLESLGQKVTVDWRNRTCSPSRVAENEPVWANLEKPLPFSPSQLLSILHLMQRPWFRRLWVRQEISLAGAAVLLCGNMSMSWHNFGNAIFIIFGKPDSPKLPRQMLTEWSLNKNRLYGILKTKHKYLSYPYLRYTLRDMEWSDPRDVIFGMLSIVIQVDRNIGIKPDYTKTAEQTFEGVASKYIRTRRYLYLLENCELVENPRLKLPSWVPQWSSRIKAHSPFYLSWSACSWISAQPEIQDCILNGLVLHAVGIKAAIVSTEARSSTEEADIEEFLSWLREVYNLHGLRDIYRSGCTSIEAFSYIIRATQSRPEENLSVDMTSEESTGGLKTTLDATCSSDLLFKDMRDCQKDFITALRSKCTGRSFILTREGSMGLVPSSTLPGDIICVLLGCNSPVVLRKLSQWTVIGVCFVPGLMNGEVIHSWPAYYRPVTHQLEKEELRIDGWRRGVFDKRDGSLITDPAQILIEMGIPVVRYIRSPHLLKCLWMHCETLMFA